MYEIENLLSMFSDYFKKKADGNLGKLMTIFSEQLKDLEESNNRVREWKDIDKAEGYGLDIIGKELNQPRGIASDEIYRVLLKSKIARNLSCGDINTIIKVLSLALDTEPSNIKIQEKWCDESEPEEAAILLIELPIQRLNEVGMDLTQFASIVKKTVAAGVKVDTIEMTGTFEFGDISLTTDTEKGFADIDQTVGGYFGAIFKSEKDQDLPL